MINKMVTMGMVILWMVLMLGCASSTPEKAVSPESQSILKLDESFDPFSLKDEDIVFPVPKQTKSRSEPSYLPVEENIPIENQFLENKLIEGFRIQLLSTKDLESATRSKAMVQERLSNLPLKFYLEFDSPYYKVRAGDFKTREEAESMRGIIRSRGYPQAWIVKTKVWSNPDFPAPSDSSAVSHPEIN